MMKKTTKIYWEKFLGTVTWKFVINIVFNNIFRVEITWSFLFIWVIWSVQPDVVVVLTNIGFLYEPCIF